MNRKLLLALAGFAAFVQAQSKPDAAPEFEVASIRTSAPISQGVTVGVHIDGAQVSCLQLSLRDYIAAAYKVKDYQIQGPDWMASARFDIVAKLASGAKQDQVPGMIGALLADRFQMKMHHESKEFPVYGLVVGKSGMKLKPSPPDSPADSAEAGDKSTVNVGAKSDNAGTFIDMGKGSYLLIGSNRIEAKKVTMAALATVLARFTDRPVVDMTGSGLSSAQDKPAQDKYDFTLEFSPEDFRAMMIRAAVTAGVVMPPETLKLLDAASGDTMLTALDTIGLKLESRRAPLDVLVIDHMERSPSEN
jgi:uncharacterized protein (TIGR03435 family)